MSKSFRLCWFVTYFRQGDAISTQGVAVHEATLKMGIESVLFTPHPELTGVTSSEFIGDYKPQPNDVRVLHYGARGPTEDWILGYRGRTYIYYHNVTPVRFFERIHFPWVENLRRARETLSQLTHLGALAVSEYNKQELLRFGFKDVTVIPLILDFEGFSNVAQRTKPSKVLGRVSPNDSVNWLHVGRIVPNKRLEDVIRAFYVYHKQLNSNSHLFFVGSNNESDIYSRALAAWIEKLSMQHAITFTGKVSKEELFDLYRLADLYLCMSEHEGFCIPLVEAMLSKTPVIAFRSTAITDTIGESGILIDEKDSVVIAKIANLVLNKPNYQEDLINRQLKQAQKWHSDKAIQILRNWLTTL